MRRFRVLRQVEDWGPDWVADGCQFNDGTTVIRWLGEYRSSVTWGRIEDAYRIHGHHGNTEIRFLDGEDQAYAELDRADVGVIPRVPCLPSWLSDGEVWPMVPMNNDTLSPAEAREYAARYLAAADEAERRAAEKKQ